MYKRISNPLRQHKKFSTSVSYSLKRSLGHKAQNYEYKIWDNVSKYETANFQSQRDKRGKTAKIYYNIEKSFWNSTIRPKITRTKDGIMLRKNKLRIFSYREISRGKQEKYRKLFWNLTIRPKTTGTFEITSRGERMPIFSLRDKWKE